MNKLIFSLAFLISLSSFGQEVMNYPKYTLSEVYEMISREKSDTFALKNANIILDTIADQNYLLRFIDLETLVPVRNESIEIHKSIVFENVFAEPFYPNTKYGVGFNRIIFHKPVTIKNSSVWLSYNHFKSSVNLRYDEGIVQSLKENFNHESARNRSYAIAGLEHNNFDLDPIISSSSGSEEEFFTSLWIRNCTLGSTKDTRDINWFLSGFSSVTIENNTFLGDHSNYIAVGDSRNIFSNNHFNDRIVQIFIQDEGVKYLRFQENKINQVVWLRLPESVQSLQMDWDQFSSGLIGLSNYNDFIVKNVKSNTVEDFDLNFRNKEVIKGYLDSARIINKVYYKSEIALIGSLNAIYRRQHDLESANASYIALKDLETHRLEYLYEQNPSFKTFFTWKINQFLKVFSAYGTEPARAIIFSLYVILAFALIYLFFPNSWDAHGKNRIVDRYRFFFKYLNRNAGIHEVYLEEKRQDLLGYEEFKTIITNSEKSVPRFFSVTALPLYQWAVSGTQISAKILSKVDILKGTWEDLPAGQKAWKSFLLVGGFLIALVYDLLIKVLNALMLSINTFTTLGFGEIPIKGLPRYLAIIQGFIGWFMLTIFSVSLISQLLN
jgi:hypothetical protein